MINFISTQQTLSIRNDVLREGKLQLNECIFPGDDQEATFHLGYFLEEQLACVASFHPVARDEYPGKAYQLRGMATYPEFQGKGYGNKLLNFAIVYLKGQKVNYLWCNARKTAFRFYLGIGFEFISDEFDVPGIGPHKAMYLKIQ